jgi:hypothetical protein
MIFLCSCYRIVLAAFPVYTNPGDLDCDSYFAYEHPIANSSDCDAAIALIPSGRPEFQVEDAARYGGGSNKPIALTWTGREQLLGPLKVSLPAAFVSGSCMVLVRGVKGQGRPPKTSRAASLMIFYFWPKVKQHAQRISQECVRGRNENGALTQLLLLDGWSYQYVVEMLGAPDELPTSRTLDPPQMGEYMLDRYNIYAAGGRVNRNMTTVDDSVASSKNVLSIFSDNGASPTYQSSSAA